MDLRAKLARLRSEHTQQPPPAALVEAPAWPVLASAPGPQPSAASPEALELAPAERPPLLPAAEARKARLRAAMAALRSVQDAQTLAPAADDSFAAAPGNTAADGIAQLTAAASGDAAPPSASAYRLAQLGAAAMASGDAAPPSASAYRLAQLGAAAASGDAAPPSASAYRLAQLGAAAMASGDAAPPSASAYRLAQLGAAAMASGDAAPPSASAYRLAQLGAAAASGDAAPPSASAYRLAQLCAAAMASGDAALPASAYRARAADRIAQLGAAALADCADDAVAAASPSKLSQRIARLRAASAVERAEGGAGSAQPAKAERIAKLRSLIADVAARDRLRAPAEPPTPREHAPPPWLQEPTEHGPLHVCTRYLEPDHHHGHSPVRAALVERPGTIPSLVCDPEYAGLDLSRALYLDTETTGLAGGTGTVAFLVGLARFEDASLCVEQLIVPQLGSETPVLARLAERLASASCLITYNGKSFDWPLLRTRFVLARLPVPPVPPHIDLLHVCRRVWKERLPSVRLVDMEREVLRFEREDDLPGSEIPARYFEFLRGGSPDRLCPVLEHNQNDLIALAALLGAVMEQYTGERTLCSPTDALHYGRLALRARDLERARSFGQDALTHSDCQRQARAALTLCSEIEHKLGRIPEAIAHLERALEHAQQLSATARSELDALAEANLHFTLAKLYEHEQHDLVRALRHARNTELVEGPMLHGRRLGRLVRRLLRSAADTA